MATDITFTVAKVIEDDWLLIAGSPDEDEPYTSFTRWFQYIHGDAQPWTHQETNWWARSATTYFPPGVDKTGDWALVGMSQEGHVEFSFRDSVVEEKIAGAGVFVPDAVGWGYVSSIRQIGDFLFVCGGGGQIYKRVSTNIWEHMDAGLLQTPPITDRLLLSDIDGPSERDIYVCGSFPGPAGLEGRLFHFEGATWRRVDIPETGYLNRILIESPDSIWICGHNGALLNGNARSGFKDMSSVEDNQLFYSMARFGQKLYLASNLGLYEYKLNDPQAKIREVVTGLIPPVRDTVTVDTAGKVLWSIGEKDIVRFDGSAWTRVDHPDNPPIR
ncbi:hypothetical protein P3T42_000987 [Paraburkholderia sp. GAS38]|jgi:hypothetical protein|uniref:hypothetical protein n=1 Tax=Paraburkholderia sp. GAS38 TaxID=3035133 RepID=UPI003D1F9C45